MIELSQPHVWTKDREAIGGVVTGKQSYQPARAGDAVSLYSIYYTEGKPTLSKTRLHGVELWLEPMNARDKKAL